MAQMTTVAEFAEGIGVRPCDVGTRIIRLKEKERWPGKELKEPIIVRNKRGASWVRMVRSLSPEQQQAIIDSFVEAVREGGTRVPAAVEFVRNYQEQMAEGTLSLETSTPKGPERM